MNPEPTEGDAQEGRLIPGRHLRLDDGEEVSLIPPESGEDDTPSSPKAEKDQDS